MNPGSTWFERAFGMGQSRPDAATQSVFKRSRRRSQAPESGHSHGLTLKSDWRLSGLRLMSESSCHAFVPDPAFSLQLPSFFFFFSFKLLCSLFFSDILQNICFSLVIKRAGAKVLFKKKRKAELQAEYQRDIEKRSRTRNPLCVPLPCWSHFFF